MHEFLPTTLAQKEALEYLKKISLDNIALYRTSQCSLLEIFFVSLIRALMTKEMKLIVVTPFHLVENLRDIDTILVAIEKLGIDKEILILDTTLNEMKYKGSQCNMIE